MYTLATSGFGPCDLQTRIYQGEIFKFSGIPAIAALIDFTQSFLEAAFHPYRPRDIHRHYSHAEQVALFASHEKTFSQSTEVKRLWTAVFEAAGLDPSGTARDRLHLRFQPHQAENASLPR